MGNTLENKPLSWKKVLAVSFAFLSCGLGSGYASGQIPLQFFCTGGGWFSILAVWFFTAFMCVFCSLAYIAGSRGQFEKPSDAFEYYAGKTGAKIFDILTLITVGIMSISMFAGCGATINQYTGVPQYVGAIAMGVVACVVVCLGINKLTNVLSGIGVVLLAFIIIVAVASFANPEIGLMEAANKVPQLVAEEKVIEPGLFGYVNPWLTPLYYVGCTIILLFPLTIQWGKDKIRTKKEAILAGIGSGIFFGGTGMVMAYTIMLNLDYIVEHGIQVPILAAIARNIPFLEPFFAVVIILAIFTTITGFLWLIGRRFAPDRTKKQTIIVIALSIFGIFFGSLIPFSKFISMVTPTSGVFGMALFICMIVQHIRRKKFAAESEKAE